LHASYVNRLSQISWESGEGWWVGDDCQRASRIEVRGIGKGGGSSGGDDGVDFACEKPEKIHSLEGAEERS